MVYEKEAVDLHFIRHLVVEKLRIKQNCTIFFVFSVCIADISSNCAGYKALSLCDLTDASSFFFRFLVQNCNATCGECERELKGR